jgi:hypothetical protein
MAGSAPACVQPLATELPGYWQDILLDTVMTDVLCLQVPGTILAGAAGEGSSSSSLAEPKLWLPRLPQPGRQPPLARYELMRAAFAFCQSSRTSGALHFVSARGWRPEKDHQGACMRPGVQS